MNRLNFDNGSAFAHYSVVSEDTPNFAEIRRLKLPLPNHPYFCSSWSGNDPPVMTYNGQRRQIDVGNVLACCEPYSMVVSGYGGPSWASMFAQVENKLSMKAHQIEVNVGESLGEYKGTLRTVKTCLTSIVKAVRAAKRGNIDGVVRSLFHTNESKGIKDILKDAVDVDLALKFGIIPLMQVVHDSIEKWESGMKRSNAREVRASMNFSHSAHIENAYAVFQGSASTVGSSIIKYGVSNPIFADMQACNITNPAMVAWELLPLSFVLDWFVPIGKFIQCVAPPAGLSFVSGCTSLRSSGSGTYSADIQEPAPGWHTMRTYDSCVVKQRRPLSAFPRFVIQFPEVSDFYLEKSKCISLIELLVQSKL